MANESRIHLCRETDIAEEADLTNVTSINRSMETSKIQEEILSHGQLVMPITEGSYILGKLQGQEVAYTVDNGANDTFVSVKFYYSIPEDVRPKLWKCRRNPQAANGSAVKSMGRAPFKLQLGPVTIERILTVGDITDEVLLGDDILRLDPDGPADILNSKQCIKFKGETIPLYTVGTTRPRIRVVAAQDVTIPAMAEIIVDGFLERSEEIPEKESSLLMEMEPSFIDRYQCLVAPTLNNIEGKVTTQVRVMNPFSKDTTIPGEAVLGFLEEAIAQDVILTEEDHNQGDLSHVRRIMMRRECIIPTPEEGYQKTAVPPEHLHELYGMSTEGKTIPHKKAIGQMLCQYQDVFSKDEFDLGETHLVEHHIETGNARPIKLPPRRVPLAFAGEDKKEFDKLMKRGVIQPSTSPWAAPVVLVRKPDGSARMCVDYRELNKVTRDDAFPIPRTQDCLDALSGATIFSTMDVTSAYHQIPMAEEDRCKTAVVSKYGLYEYLKMPFGLKTAPATYQRLMELALAGLQWTICLIYLDDVIVFSQTFDEHVERLTQVFQRFRDAGLKLKPDKCHFFEKEVTFLGHLLSAEGVLPDPKNIKKILEWPVPEDSTDVRGFLGLGSYYRRFVKEYARKMAPLFNILKKDQAFDWSQECQEAFEKEKTTLVSADIMAYPADVGQYILDTDASQNALGAVLSQIQDGRERVIAYGSRTLSKAERNYCVTDRELLAVRYFIEYYKQYLMGRKFTVRTDHQALKWLYSMKEPKDRIARWLETLSTFQFEVEYRPGAKHGNADGMSRRCPNPQDCRCPVFEEEVLKCGPCSKCIKRSIAMQSNLPGLTPESPDQTTEAMTQDISRTSRLSHRRSKLGRTGRQRDRTQPTPTDPPSTENRKSWAFPYSLVELRKQQLEDPDIGPVIQWKENDIRPCGTEVSSASAGTRHYWLLWGALHLKDGALFRRFTKRDGTGEYLQLIVPTKLRRKILHQCHDALLGGHLGR